MISITFFIFFAAFLLLTHSEIIQGLNCTNPRSFIQRELCASFIYEGCEKMVDGKCSICKFDYILEPQNGTCLSLKVLNDYKTEALDLGEPIVDITNDLEENFGASARSVHNFNLRNRHYLSSYYIRKGISQSAILGIYLTLYYRNQIDSTQIMIIAFTECSGRISQIFYLQSKNPNTRGPVSMAQDYTTQFGGIELFKIDRINEYRTQVFQIYMRNGSDVFYLVYYLNEASFREKIQSSLIDIVRPYVATKLKTLNSDFDLDAANATKISNRTVLFKYRNSTISAELFGCNIIVNNIITAKPIADTFFQVFQKAKNVPQTLIPNLPQYKDIVQNQQNSNYRVIFAVKNEAKKTQISLEVELVNQGEESFFSNYIIDGVPITQDLLQADEDIKFDPPDADNKFSYKLQNIYCQVFKEDGFLCDKCIKGYQLSVTGFCVDTNCIEFLQDKCRICKEGYRIAGEICEKEVEFCADYNSLTYRCKECIGGFYLQENGQCALIPVENCKVYNERQGCQQCLFGYNYYNDTCEFTIDFCLQYDGEVCILCVDGFIPQDGVCISSPCPVNQFLKPNGEHVTIPTNCEAFNVIKQICERCEQGYRLKDNECVPGIRNCRAYEGLKCIECLDRYYLLQNSCAPVDLACLTYNMSNGDCISCQQTYVLSEGKCRATQCPPSHVITPQGFCFEVPAGCVINLQTKKCSSCSDGYYLLENGSCQSVDTLCIQFNQTREQCLSCKQGSVLQNGRCSINGV